MRHAEAQKKTEIFGPRPRDPGLSDVGKAQCSTFVTDFKDHSSHVTHILCSPMKRAINTAIAAFPDVVGKTLTVYAMPELQSLDRGPGGVGAGFSKLSKKYRAKEGEVPRVDVTTFGRKGWNDKDGVWSPSEANWRVDFVKGFLRGLLAATTNKIIEVVIISHRSFLNKLLKHAKTGFMVVNTCALFQDGELRSIGDSELKRLREGQPLSAEAGDDGPKEENG
jgi:broad specificity phosphatase PhoE